ncbi:Cytochrome P450 [Glarea lozoyensis ATCC 20868]|uniref:Cytochrome P450 n=1 Tax=Glarea lozoyensis (strain ATCC 20868 / MF5171) TaxID=1116229 RepID=S3EDL9_GLAL2|nr:Cytochrome P450 [Glarea lozoyensis ATCC 20868]EPE36373.1 Cytochrome P450 [Glarea lozoyensis ATCC 20868]
MSHLTVGQYAILVFGAMSVYASFRCIYFTYFHPASKFPGPRIAAISNVWYAYHWITGKYPMAIENAFKKYGDVVRIAPNELKNIPPLSGIKSDSNLDIYGSHSKHIEKFLKADFISLGDGDQGITWEKDPIKHRHTAKKLSPAFSAKSIKAKESTIHKYVDLFVQKMKKIGQNEQGVELKIWTDWVSMDISAELSYSRELEQVEKMSSSAFLHALWGVNFFVNVHQILKKFPLSVPLQFLFVPPSALISELQARKLNRETLEWRIEHRGGLEHLDHVEQLLSAEAPPPTGQERKALEVVSGQLLIAGYLPVASQFLCTIMFGLQEPDIHRLLVREIRESFARYEDITAEALAPLKFLHGSIMETLRFTFVEGGGLPRVSPGAIVDGRYIEKGLQVQYGHFAFTRSPRYFHEPRSYRPQHWLPKDHPHWNAAFENDATSHYYPFGLGPRQCIGMELAWREMRIFVAKVLWSFDVEMVSDHKIVYERDFKMHRMWEKPEFWVRFHPVDRSD